MSCFLSLVDDSFQCAEVILESLGAMCCSLYYQHWPVIAHL